VRLAFISGATGGLGRALASLLAAKKIPLFLTARDPVNLQELANSLSTQTHVEWVSANLISELPLILQVIEEKTPDLIINNAGFGLYGSVDELNEHIEMIDVNVKALVAITKKAAQTLKAMHQTGTILNISSAAGYFSIPYFATYCASKAFVRIFSEAVDEELSPSGIRVLVACPGQINTPFCQRASKGEWQYPKGPSMSPERTAHLLWKQIIRGKRCAIIDLRYRLAITLSVLFPKKWLQKKLAATILKRIKQDD